MFDKATKSDVQKVETAALQVDARVADVGRQVGDANAKLRQLCDALLPKPAEPKAQVPMRTMRREEAKNFYGGGLYLIV